MASRAIILRRKKFLLGYLNDPICTVRGFSIIQHGLALQNLDSWATSWVIDRHATNVDCRKEEGIVSVSKKESLGLSTMKPLKPSSSINLLLYPSVGRSKLVPDALGVQWMSHSIRNASTAVAREPEYDDDEERSKEKIVKQKMEASPEECDQAVEGLGLAKAKVKAKKLLDSKKTAYSILQRFWAMLLGISPALRTVASMSREDWAKKFHHWNDEFKSTTQHYWLGAKLFWADTRISYRLLLKLAHGKSLSRRERQQLTRTTADLFRLIPFAVFILVPFMELLLPVFLKLFPNMLPSTFQDKMKAQEALKRKLIARIEYAKFLQDTAKEMAKEVQNSHSGDVKKTAEDLGNFLNKVRTGSRVSNEEILGFAKLFKNELTLDNVSKPRLVNMCKYMGISPYGTEKYLRFMLRKRLERIKNDDKMIQAEGVESLSEGELRQACRDRGLLGLLSVEEMRKQLHDWLDLSLKHSVPSSLLILSRAFTVSGKLRLEEAVMNTMSSLPDEVVGSVGLSTLTAGDSLSDKKRKLEYLEMQEELIREEQDEKKQAMKNESEISGEDVALKEMTLPTAREARELAREKAIDKQEQLCKLSRALAVLASASSVNREREEFLRLVYKEIDIYNSIVEKEGAEGEKEAKKAYRAVREKSEHASKVSADDKVSSALIDRVGAMLPKLEKDIDDVDAKIGDQWRLLDSVGKEPLWCLLGKIRHASGALEFSFCRDSDGKVTPEEVAAAAAAIYLKDTLDKDGIQELISNLSKDREGKILVEDIVKLGSHAEDENMEEDNNFGASHVQRASRQV